MIKELLTGKKIRDLVIESGSDSDSDDRAKYEEWFDDMMNSNGFPPSVKGPVASYSDEELKNLYDQYMTESKKQFDETKNSDIVALFLRSSPTETRFKRSEHLFIRPEGSGIALVNYTTPIAYKDANGNVYLNNTRYSQTTSKIQNNIRRQEPNIKELPADQFNNVLDGLDDNQNR